MRSPCIVPGCGKPRKGKGLCETHYKAFQRSEGLTVTEFVERALNSQAVSDGVAESIRKKSEGYLEALERCRLEWATRQFIGDEETASRKREVLAHLELTYFWVVACDRANVRRYEYLRWRAEDEVFLEAEFEATESACQRAEYQMLATGAPPDGKTNPKALIMWLNKYADWNPMSKTADEMHNKRFVEAVSKVIRETLTSDAAGPVIEKLNAMADRHNRLPSGTRL